MAKLIRLIRPPGIRKVLVYTKSKDIEKLVEHRIITCHSWRIVGEVVEFRTCKMDDISNLGTELIPLSRIYWIMEWDITIRSSCENNIFTLSLVRKMPITPKPITIWKRCSKIEVLDHCIRFTEDDKDGQAIEVIPLHQVIEVSYEPIE